MTVADRTSDDAVLELELDTGVRVQVRSRLTGVIGVVVVVALVGAAVAMMGRGGSSEAAARIEAFHAAMVERVSFAYELDLTVEGVTGSDVEDIVPGGAVDLLQIDGKVAAEDRYSMVVRHSDGVDELVRVGPDIFQREVGAGDDSWWQTEYEEPEPPSVEDIRTALTSESEMDAADARLMAISGIYLERIVLNPARLPSLLSDIDPEAAVDDSTSTSTADSVADAFDGVSVVGTVPFPISYAEVVPDAPPMTVTVQLGPDGRPGSARLAIADGGGVFAAELRFSDWGSDIEVVAPESWKDAFSEVGTAIEDSDPDQPAEDELDGDGPQVLPEPGGLDPSMLVWVPTNVPDDFSLVELEPADVSGDDSCRGVFAIWMASGRPAADWVSQDTPDSDNSQLLTVMSVPVECQFVARTPLFEPGPFGEVPARRNGDQWEVLLDDTWVVRFDSVVVAWDELVAMVESLDTVSLRSLQEQLG